jgi:hypothetical protein
MPEDGQLETEARSKKLSSVFSGPDRVHPGRVPVNNWEKRIAHGSKRALKERHRQGRPHEIGDNESPRARDPACEATCGIVIRVSWNA